MNNFVENINRKISILIKEIVEEEKKVEKTLNTEDEKQKLRLISMYYRIVLHGCENFSDDINNLTKAIKNLSSDDDSEFYLEQYYERADEDKNSTNENDIELDENPQINIHVEEVYDDNDIVLDENPPINIEVAEVHDINDIELDENPKIDVDVAEVYDEDDIVLDENPPINIDVAEVYDADDIVLNENPNIKIEVAKVEVEEGFKKDDKFKDKSELFGNLRFEVSDVSPDFSFNREEFEKQIAEERAAKRAKLQKNNDIILNENPQINIHVEEVYDDNDIVLDENPPINIEVAEVYDEDDIVLDENPPINIDVSEVYDEDDIVLDENPSINIDVADVKEEKFERKAKEETE